MFVLVREEVAKPPPTTAHPCHFTLIRGFHLGISNKRADASDLLLGALRALDAGKSESLTDDVGVKWVC